MTQEAKPKDRDLSQNDDLKSASLVKQFDNEWLTVSEACQYARCSKPFLYTLFRRGLVRNVSFRERGKTRGLRRVSFDSLKYFLEFHATGGMEAKEDARSLNLESTAAHRIPAKGVGEDDVYRGAQISKP